jgi:hypothetical protein
MEKKNSPMMMITVCRPDTMCGRVTLSLLLLLALLLEPLLLLVLDWSPLPEEPELLPLLVPPLLPPLLEPESTLEDHVEITDGVTGWPAIVPASGEAINTIAESVATIQRVCPVWIYEP